MKHLSILALSLAACGRTGFEELATDAATPIDAPPSLACGGERFSTGMTTTSIAATPSADGYFVLAVDSGGIVTGAVFQWAASGGALTQTTSVPVAISSNATSAVAGVGLDDGVLVEVPYGRPDTTGTRLIPLDRDLATRGPAVEHDGWIAGPGMLARAGASIALLGQDTSTKDIAGQLVDASGGFIGPPITLIDSATNPQGATITAAGDRFLVTWAESGANAAETRARLFDGQLAAKTGVIAISSNPQYGAQLPRAAYAAGADRYLFAWYQKVNGGTDEVWISLRDGELQEIGAPQKIAAQGTLPVIAAGDDGFLLVWQTSGPRLGAARVAMDGTSSSLGVTTTGGNASGWDVVARDGQPTLVWVESGGSGPNLWLDPLCH